MGGNSERTNLEVVQALCGLMGELFEARPELGREFSECAAANGRPCDSRIGFVRDRPGHDRHYAIDAGRIADQLGFRPRIAFREGLRRTLEWHLDHPGWWRAVMDSSYRGWVDRHYGSPGGGGGF